MHASRLLSRHHCRLSTLCGPHAAAAWVHKTASNALTVTHAKQRNKRERQDDPGGIDSTNDLLLDRVESPGGQRGDVLDIDELLNDEAAMGALRAMLKAEMAAAHSTTSTTAAAATAAAPAPAANTQQPPARPRNRAFDSDEYDSSALESMLDTDNNSSVDFMAQDAAKSLLLESQEIAEHILHEHENDSMLGKQQGRTGSKQPTSSSASSQGGTFKLKLPSFAAGGNSSDTRTQQQQPGRADKGKSGSNNRSSSREGSGSGQQGRGSRGAPAAGGSSSGGRDDSSSSSSSTGPRRLSNDSALGRVAEARGGVPLVVLKQGKARLFEMGSPMVYGGAVECVVARPPPSAGDVVVVCDNRMTPIGWGVYNDVSMFRVRILQSESEALSSDDSVVLNLPALLDVRLGEAVQLRACLGLPSTTTNAYRLVNSEGDRLSGLIVDVLGDVVVVQSCAAWTERYKNTIIQLLQKHTGSSRIVWRPTVGILKEEGIDYTDGSNDSSSSSSSSSGQVGAAADAEDDLSPLASLVDASSSGSSAREGGSPQQHSKQQQSSSSSSSSGVGHETVEVQEAGLTFLATPESGQKTGFYADQRQNRAFIASLSAGKTVLDLCCYSGGFAISAAAAGAAAVTGVDSSASAVQMAQDNAELNGLTDRCAFVRDDVSTFLRAALEAGESWDVVVLDPPKLAPNRGSLPRASSKYRRLNELALGVVRPGGVLMSCSCSGAMTQSGGLGKVVQEAARAADRQVTLLSKAGAAPDHPLNPGYPEGEYLTALTYRVV